VKALVDVLSHAGVHWVGDGFPVRTVFFYEQRGQELSPFLLLDCAGPYRFGPAKRPRGVGPHPHRGFETVTIVYDGEVAHRDFHRPRRRGGAGRRPMDDGGGGHRAPRIPFTRIYPARRNVPDGAAMGEPTRRP
jgi:redox-sensitive bicupin YhaK (pirin superfamily)